MDTFWHSLNYYFPYSFGGLGAFAFEIEVGDRYCVSIGLLLSLSCMGPTDRFEWLKDNQLQWAVQADLQGNGSSKMLIGCDCCKRTAGLTLLRARVFV